MANLDPIEVEIKVNLKFDVSWKQALKMRLAGATAISEYVKHLIEKEKTFQSWLEDDNLA